MLNLPMVAINHYLKTSDGLNRLGPYASRAVAESILSNMPVSERNRYVIESLTQEGKSVLLG